MTTSSELNPVHSDTDPHSRNDSNWVRSLLALLLPLIRGWRWIFGITFVGGVVSIGLVLVLTETFQAKATLLLTASKSSPGGSLAKLAGGDLGSLLTMNDNSSEDEMLVVLAADTLSMRTIREFQLDRVWKMDTTKEIRRENLLKNWAKSFSFEFGEEGQLRVGYIDEDPKLARDVLLAHINRIDSAWLSIKRMEAAKKAKFAEERADERMALLESRMDSLIEFQIKNRIFDPNEQIRQTVEAVSQLETKLAGVQISREYSRRVEGGSKVGALNELTSILQSDADRLTKKGAGNDASGTGLLMNLTKALPLSALYQKKVRLLQLDLTVAEGLAKQVEQLKIESLRDVSVLQMVDPPVVPKKRHSPARMATVELLTALSFVFACCLAYLMDFFRRSPVERAMLRELLKAWK